MAGGSKRSSFMVQIIDTQNQTWQGTVTWLDGKHTQPFRSLLELIKLIDSAVSGGEDVETAGNEDMAL